MSHAKTPRRKVDLGALLLRRPRYAIPSTSRPKIAMMLGSGTVGDKQSDSPFLPYDQSLASRMNVVLNNHGDNGRLSLSGAIPVLLKSVLSLGSAKNQSWPDPPVNESISASAKTVSVIASVGSLLRK